jgi:hypothetical protein
LKSRSVFVFALYTAQHVSGVPTPILRSSTTAVAASGFTVERGDSSAVGRGRAGRPAGPTTTNSTAITKASALGQKKKYVSNEIN